MTDGTDTLNMNEGSPDDGCPFDLLKAARKCQRMSGLLSFSVSDFRRILITFMTWIPVSSL